MKQGWINANVPRVCGDEPRFLECVSRLYPVEDGAIDKTIKGLGYEPDDIIKRNFNRE